MRTLGSLEHRCLFNRWLYWSYPSAALLFLLVYRLLRSDDDKVENWYFSHHVKHSTLIFGLYHFILGTLSEVTSFILLDSLLRLSKRLQNGCHIGTLWVKIQGNLIMGSANILLSANIYSYTGSDTSVISLQYQLLHFKRCPRQLTLFEAGTLGSQENRSLCNRWWYWSCPSDALLFLLTCGLLGSDDDKVDE